MKRFLGFVFLVTAVIAPSLVLGDMLHLKDGSSIKGKLVRANADSIYFETSFGVEMRIPRSQVVRIDFVDGNARQAPAPRLESKKPTPVTSAPTGSGTLVIEFDDFEVSSTISVHRDKDREGHERENVIHTIVTVDGTELHTAIDSTTDKVIKKGIEVIVRNKARPQRAEMPLDAGVHSVRVLISNKNAGTYRDRFVNKPLFKPVDLGNITIHPDRVTRVVIGLDKKKFGLKGTELVVR